LQKYMVMYKMKKTNKQTNKQTNKKHILYAHIVHIVYIYSIHILTETHLEEQTNNNVAKCSSWIIRQLHKY